LAVTAALAGIAPQVQRWLGRGWGQHQQVAPAGPEESRIQQLLLGEAPTETRFAGLFEYFAAGFVRHAVPGYARVHYAGAGSRNGYAMDGLEGFARTAPLLAAWIRSGRESPAASSAEILAMLRSGILTGVNPHSSEYWGDFRDEDQRVVEAADVARVVWLTRASLWDKLSDRERGQVHAWLAMAANTRTPHTNWMLFPILINLTLASLEDDGDGEKRIREAHSAFAEYKQLYRDHGWFYDPPYGIDFYNTWGMTYELSWLHLIDPDFEPEVITAAIRESAELTQYLISPRGIPIMGRSVCYRTAVPVPLVAASLLESDPFPAGKAQRALDVVWRYFVGHESLRDGALTQGYFKADLRLLDTYSGTGSCHWGLRSLVLAFMHPPADAFWSAPQQPLPVEIDDYRLELTKLGWVVNGTRRNNEITITVVGNPTDVNTIDEYTWAMKVRELFAREPLRPHNHEVKYESRHYSSASPYPLLTPPADPPR
jgi:hypothetical protein